MTLSSMTGFGRARGELSERLSLSVVVRAVNHRFLDLQVRVNLREEMPEAEAIVREVLGARLERGRVTTQLVFERTGSSGARVSVDRAAVASVLEQLRQVATSLGGGAAVEVRDVLAVPGLVVVTSDETELDGREQERLRQLVGAACAQLEGMRREEGEHLVAQVSDELGSLRGFLDWLEPQLPELRQRLLERLRERLGELLAGGPLPDEGRLAQEAALAADRAEVGEEVVRLRSHLAAFALHLERGGAVGRTLDFLCQEVNRELNTLASKCRELPVVERLVGARAATERVREQVQNLE